MGRPDSPGWSEEPLLLGVKYRHIWPTWSVWVVENQTCCVTLRQPIFETEGGFLTGGHCVVAVVAGCGCQVCLNTASRIM